MTHSNRNFVLAYLMLVALPVLGLVGVLRSGRNLTAPISLGGQWKIQMDAGKLAALPCGKLLTTSQDPGFAISQSGKNFTVNVGNSLTPSSGEIDGTAVMARIMPSTGSAKDAGCGGEHVLSLTATVDPKANPRSLEGTLSVNDCPACVPVEFHAVRVDQVKSKGGH
ncbi:MAG TPA: hypothetical protein VEF05_19290 [Terriglobales bacterium]|nr:hypothetical protein [Terriglobales bacterium]